MPKGDDIVLGKLGGSGDLIPAALRWFRRRGASQSETPQIQDVAPTETASEETGSPTADLLALELSAPAPLPTADDVPELRALVEMHRNDPKLRWQLGLALVASRKLNLALAHLEVAATQEPALDQGELTDV